MPIRPSVHNDKMGENHEPSTMTRTYLPDHGTQPRLAGHRRSCVQNAFKNQAEGAVLMA